MHCNLVKNVFLIFNLTHRTTEYLTCRSGVPCAAFSLPITPAFSHAQLPHNPVIKRTPLLTAQQASPPTAPSQTAAADHDKTSQSQYRPASYSAEHHSN